MNKQTMQAFSNEIIKVSAAPGAWWKSMWSPGHAFLEKETGNIAKRQAQIIPEVSHLTSAQNRLTRLQSHETRLQNRTTQLEGAIQNNQKPGLINSMRQRQLTNTQNRLTQHQGRVFQQQQMVENKGTAMREAMGRHEAKGNIELASAQQQAGKMNFNRRIGIVAGGIGLAGGGGLMARNAMNRNTGYSQPTY